MWKALIALKASRRALHHYPSGRKLDADAVVERGALDKLR
jgi:hypothetical protein